MVENHKLYYKGNPTEFGQLTTLSKRDTIQSPVQKKIDKLITRIIITVSAVAIVAFGLALLRGMDLVESLRFVMALAVSAVPESLPIAISVILVLGMRRMAAKKALVRQMRAIETVGVINTIATATGTLTRNKLTVQAVWQPHGSDASLATAAGYSANGSAGKKSHDPLDIALIEYAKKHADMPASSPVLELPFDQEQAMSGTTWHEGADYTTYLKARQSTSCARGVTGTALQEAETALQNLTARLPGDWPGHPNHVRQPASLAQLLDGKLTFDGFAAVADILRPEAADAIQTALAAGVSVRMITGDHFETAYQIGKKLNMVDDRSQSLTAAKWTVER